MALGRELDHSWLSVSEDQLRNSDLLPKALKGDVEESIETARNYDREGQADPESDLFVAVRLCELVGGALDVVSQFNGDPTKGTRT